MNKLLYIFFIILIGSQVSYAQKVATSVDSTQIRMGSQFHLTLKTKIDSSSTVFFPEEKLFGALEVLESFPVDTIIDKKDKAKLELIKKYGLTQFDSGRYVIPQLKVLIDNKTFLSDSLYIQVNAIQVDTLKQPMHDIKEVIGSAEKPSSNIWIYLLLLAGVGAIIGLVYWLRKKKIQHKEEQISYTPIEKATIGLKKLEDKQLIERGEVKEYYSELTDITRTYLQEAVKFSAMENTTDELIQNLRHTALKRKLVFSEDMILALQKVLKQADLVKFAKSKPLEFEITTDRNIIEDSLRKMHKAIPVKTLEEEEAEKNEQLRLELEKKRKRKKLISNLSFFLGIALVIGLAYWVATNGVTTIKDKFFGSPTSEFVHSEWITSEYGNPAVRIETPLVLKRRDASDMVPEELKSSIKNISVFDEGTPFGDYYFAVSTMTFQPAPEQEQSDAMTIDLEKVLSNIYISWEALGAKNILMQKDNYKTPTGIEGMKAYGTMDYVDQITKMSKKVYYEILVFKQQGGLQQIMTIIDETDPNKKEIIDRIINSVELGQVH